MTTHLGVLMDAIADIHYKKDSTLAMLWDAKARGWQLHYFEQSDLFLSAGLPYGIARDLDVFQDERRWFQLGDKKVMPLADLQVIFMRKDPPVNEEFFYTTHILEHAEHQGVLVINRPQALRDFNEKLLTTYFPDCCPPTLITRSVEQLHGFWQTHKDIVCKPLKGMGGRSIFRLKENDVNAAVIFETLLGNGMVAAQTFIPEIVKGDKRILMIAGEPLTHALARVPQGRDWRGNLAVGAKGVVQPLSERDQWICARVQPFLREHGLYFVGLDVIGDYLTEINITSPTGIRELDAGLGGNVSGVLFDYIETRV